MKEKKGHSHQDSNCDTCKQVHYCPTIFLKKKGLGNRNDSTNEVLIVEGILGFDRFPCVNDLLTNLSTRPKKRRSEGTGNNLVGFGVVIVVVLDPPHTV